MYVRDPSRVVVTGPLPAHAGGFCAELGRRGYARASAAELMQLMAHLSRWLGFEHLEPAGLTAEVAGRFLADRRQRYRRRLPAPTGGLHQQHRETHSPDHAPNGQLRPKREDLTRFRGLFRSSSGRTSRLLGTFWDPIMVFRPGSGRGRAARRGWRAVVAGLMAARAASDAFQSGSSAAVSAAYEASMTWATRPCPREDLNRSPISSGTAQNHG
jgi:hypothetical protein